jgi:hypothetical protein
MAGTAPNPNAGPSRRQVKSVLGRTSGLEDWYSTTVALTAAGGPLSLIVPRQMNLQRPLESIEVRLSFRHQISVANKTNPLAASPYTWIDRIRINGIHRVFGAQTPIDLKGETAFVWPRLFGIKGNDALLSTTRQADPGQPFAQTLANYGNIATYDWDLSYILPVGLTLGKGARVRQTMPYLWKQQDWGDSLQMRIDFGDATAVGTVNGSTDTLTAFGSGSGSPTCQIRFNYSQMGALDNPRRASESNLVLRTEQNFTQFTAVQSAPILISNLQKRKLANLVFKAGLVATQTGGLGPNYLSFSDTLMQTSQILVDTKLIRNNTNNPSAKSHLQRMYETILPQGYNMFSFVDSMHPLTYFAGDTVGAGAQFGLFSGISSASASNLLSMIQENVLSSRPAGQ